MKLNGMNYRLLVLTAGISISFHAAYASDFSCGSVSFSEDCYQKLKAAAGLVCYQGQLTNEADEAAAMIPECKKSAPSSSNASKGLTLNEDVIKAAQEACSEIKDARDHLKRNEKPQAINSLGFCAGDFDRLYQAKLMKLSSDERKSRPAPGDANLPWHSFKKNDPLEEIQLEGGKPVARKDNWCLHELTRNDPDRCAFRMKARFNLYLGPDQLPSNDFHRSDAPYSSSPGAPVSGQGK